MATLPDEATAFGPTNYHFCTGDGQPGLGHVGDVGDPVNCTSKPAPPYDGRFALGPAPACDRLDHRRIEQHGRGLGVLDRPGRRDRDHRRGARRACCRTSGLLPSTSPSTPLPDNGPAVGCNDADVGCYGSTRATAGGTVNAGAGSTTTTCRRTCGRMTAGRQQPAPRPGDQGRAGATTPGASTPSSATGTSGSSRICEQLGDVAGPGDPQRRRGRPGRRLLTRLIALVRRPIRGRWIISLKSNQIFDF